MVLGMTDGHNGCAMVSAVGPLARLELAKRVVEIVPKEANSLLGRLEWSYSLGEVVFSGHPSLRPKG